MPPEGEQSLDELAGLLTAKPEGSGKPAGEAAPEGGEKHTPRAEHDEPAGDDANPAEGDHEGDEPDEAADEGSDAEHDDEPGEGEGEGEPKAEDDAAPEPFYTVKIDGKEERVTLKEALDGYQRQADYQRKTAELAEHRKAAEQETTGLRSAREQYSAVLKVLQDRLSTVQERTPEQWNALRAEDPTAYAAEWTDFQRREEQRNAVKAEQDRVKNEQTEADKKVFKARIDEERTKIDAAFPEWKDPAKRKASMDAIREYGKSVGFSDQELDTVYDSRMVRLAHDAAQWQKHVAAQKKARERLDQAPTSPEPRNARGSRQAAQQTQLKAQRAKFVKSGNVEDAVSLLLTR